MSEPIGIEVTGRKYAKRFINEINSFIDVIKIWQSEIDAIESKKQSAEYNNDQIDFWCWLSAQLLLARH